MTRRRTEQDVERSRCKAAVALAIIDAVEPFTERLSYAELAWCVLHASHDWLSTYLARTVRDER